MSDTPVKSGQPTGEAQFLAAILESVLVGIVSIDRAGRIETVNTAMVRLFGYRPEELIGHNVSLLMPEPHRSHHDAYIARYLATGERRVIGIGREVTGLRKDGSSFPMHLSIGEFVVGGVPHFTGILQDLTAQKHAEALLLREEALLASVFSILPYPLIICDTSHLMRLVNPAFMSMFGMTSEEAVGLSSGVVFADRALWERDMAEMDQGPQIQAPAIRALMRRADGARFQCELLRTAIHDRAGQLVGYLALMRDLTEEVKRDAALRQSQRMEAIGQLTGGVAHDFNNILTVILGNLELLAPHLKSEIAQSLAREVGEAAEMGARLTDRLLTFGGRQRLETRLIGLNEFVLGLIELLRRTLGEAIDLSTALAGDLWPTVADPVQVENALLNLAINARDAMPNGGRIVIETRNSALDDKAVSLTPGLEPGDYVVLSVSDTGLGMSREIMDRVFEPFFTTKGQGRGTGLGLATIYGFAKQSGGHVTIYSELGKGTTVNLYLPRAVTVTGAASDIAKSPPVAAGKGELVLVVEDDERVRRLTCSRLNELGYTTLEAGSGVEALSLLAGHGPKIDLVFTDLVMPGGISGLELARRVLSDPKGARVLLTSGYSEEIVSSEEAVVPGVALLRKPYRQADLARAVREALSGPRPRGVAGHDTGRGGARR